jgi:UPF0042 nucleotide-binding protein
MAELPALKRRIVIITGMAGAGLSTARETFADQGFEAIDNLPLDSVEQLLDGAGTHPIALGLDVRSRGFSAERIVALLSLLNARSDVRAELLFLECDDSILLQRFSETRRRHPLAADRPVAEGLALERAQLLPLKNRADRMVDTTELSVNELRRILSGHYPAQEGHGLLIQLMSFSYRHGVPREADLVFDARFLRNPHWVPELKAQTGQAIPVGQYIAQDPAFNPFLGHVTGLIGTMLPGLKATERTYLTIAFGCTGGKHRSVYLAEQTTLWLGQQGISVQLRHRELERTGLLLKQTG